MGGGEDTLPRAARFLSQDCVSPELPLPLPAGCSERPPRLWDLGAFFRSGWFVGRRPEMTSLLSAEVGGPAPFSFHASRRALARAGPHVKVFHTHIPGVTSWGAFAVETEMLLIVGGHLDPNLSEIYVKEGKREFWEIYF